MSNLFGDTGGPVIVRVWDCETARKSDDEDNELVELARVDFDLRTLSIGNEWTSLVRPKGTILPGVKGIHHITEAEVAGAPPIGKLWEPFWQGCGPGDLVAAHNAAFEQKFHKGNGRRWICTFKGACVVWPDAPSHKNQALRYWLDLDSEDDFDPVAAMPPHRALPDAYVTARILRRLLRERTVDELVKISEYPALLRRITFGTQAKGQTYEEAPGDYLAWLVDKSSMGEDVKFSAKYWLKKRGLR